MRTQEGSWKAAFALSISKNPVHLCWSGDFAPQWQCWDAAAPVRPDAAGKRGQTCQSETGGGLHDDAGHAAFGDLLQRLPVVGVLDCFHDVILIRETPRLQLGEDQLPVDLNLKAATSSHEARHVRLGELAPDDPGELLVAGLVPSCSAEFHSNCNSHRACGFAVVCSRSVLCLAVSEQLV